MRLDFDLLGAALDYARRGWFVLPLYSVVDGKCSCGDPICKAIGKHPRLEGWTTKATTDEDQIKAWFTQWPDSNIGVLLGQASKLVVIDVDGKDGMDWIKSIDTSGAITATSGREFHRHYFFQYPDSSIRTKIRLLNEVDLLADNRYIVVAPSRHASGSIYRFHNLGSQAPGPLPEEVFKVFNSQSSKSSSISKSGAVIRKGHRNSTLTSLAGKMRRDGFSREAIYAALRETNMEHCDPPLNEVEIIGIANSIANYEPDSNPIHVLKTISASSLLAREFPPQRWVVKELLSPGLGVLAGPPKFCKSLLALQLSASCSHGTPFLNEFPVEQGSCLFLGLEDNERRLKERSLIYLDINDKIGLDLLEFSTELPQTSSGGINLIENWILSKNDARLIVIDTMARIRRSPGRNSNIYLEDTSFLSPIQKLALSHQVCILLIHHTRKAYANDPLNAISGSTGITGAADICWILNRRDRNRPEGSLTIIGRDVESQTLKLFLTESLKWEFRGIDNETHNTPEREEILSTLAEASGPMKTSEIALKLGKSSSLISHLLSKLNKEGLVVSPGYGRYTLPKKAEGSHE